MTETTTELLRFPLHRPGALEPSPDYSRLREQLPISRVVLPTGQSAWLVTRHADVRALLLDSRLSSDRGHPNFPLRRPVRADARRGLVDLGKSLIGLDAPEHSAPRRMVITEFSVRRMRQLRPRVQQIVDERIDAMLAAGPDADLVAGLALPVPSMVISELLGVPGDSRGFFTERTQVLLRTGSSDDERAKASDDLREFMDDLVSAKERDGGDDLLGRLIERNRETGVFTHDLLVGMGLLLLLAGHETTSNMIALGTIALLRQPDALAELRADLSRVPETVEELLRCYPIIDGLPRVARTDLEIDGVRIAAGDGVLLSLGSANRDGASFADSDRFDVHRGDRRHVSFAYGIHQCLGQNLARMELELVFGTLLRRIPNLRLASAVEDLPFKDSAAINGVYRLPVAW